MRDGDVANVGDHCSVVDQNMRDVGQYGLCSKLYGSTTCLKCRSKHIQSRRHERDEIMPSSASARKKRLVHVPEPTVFRHSLNTLRRVPIENPRSRRKYETERHNARRECSSHVMASSHTELLASVDRTRLQVPCPSLLQPRVDL